MTRSDESDSRHNSSAQDEIHARVASVFGPRVLIETDSGQQYQCLLGSRKLKPVCGDEVFVRAPTESAEGVLTQILARRSELQRPDNRGRTEVLAANITQLVVVSAIVPEPDAFLIDRYLVAAKLMKANAVCVLNKVDLMKSTDDLTLFDLTDYESLSYTVVHTSARCETGTQNLESTLTGHTSILVGQSGVGKSSLLNRILPGTAATTRPLSEATGFGRHTTSASTLYRLGSGAHLIDSPGVRDFAPPPIPDRDVAGGFVEFEPHIENCRFNDCMHLDEPDCAVKQAVADGKIFERRYESYKRMVALMRELADKQKP